MNKVELVEEAREAKDKAFAPYSEYPVGAAVETDKGVFQGCNMEVSGRVTSIHAEMFAFFRAEFHGATEYHKLAVSAGEGSKEFICGLCQHTIAQFTEDILIIEDTGDGTAEMMLSELIGPAYSPSTRHDQHVNGS